MGTSAPSNGPSNATPLVPSWLPEKPIPPAAPPDNNDGDSDKGDEVSSPDQNSPPIDQARPAIQEPPQTQRFRSPRRKFNAYANSGGLDGAAGGKALGGYVRTGVGGAKNATQRMGGSRATAGNILQMFHNIQSDGLNETLTKLNLTTLSGKTPAEICTGLTEAICEDQEGGPIDEAIARDAWLSTIIALPDLGVTDLEILSTEQIEAVFIEFITNSIQSRIMQDIGAQTLKIADSIADIENLESQLHGYINNCVKDSLASEFNNITDWDKSDISEIVDETYQSTFNSLESKEDE